MCQPRPPEAQTQLPHIPISEAALNPSLGMLWPFRCHRNDGSVPAVPLTALGTGKRAHKQLLQSKTKQKDQLLPDQVIYLPSGEAQLLFATSFWTGIQLCILTQNIRNKTFSGEGRNFKFFKITVKSVSKPTQGVLFSHLPFLFPPPRKPFPAGFSPRCWYCAGFNADWSKVASGYCRPDMPALPGNSVSFQLRKQGELCWVINLLLPALARYVLTTRMTFIQDQFICTFLSQGLSGKGGKCSTPRFWVFFLENKFFFWRTGLKFVVVAL